MSALLAMVIPTRNRAQLAITAVRYLLQQPGSDLLVFVSDNSSIESEVRLLENFCRELGDPRVTYMRTSGDLAQGTHWDWATREALRRSNATHVTVHYDRKLFRPNHVRHLAGVAAQFPGKVVTYVSDSVSFVPAPLRVWQPPWTGAVYSLRAAVALEASARAQAFEMAHTLPVLSNCIVPRHVVETLVERFGTFCESTTADSCFTYRFLATFDDYLHFDRSLAILYASHRSAGIGYLRGVGGDFADYLKTWRGEAWLDAAPVPGINLGYNMLFHEYELVRRSPAGARLRPLDRAACLRDLARGLPWIEDDRLRAGLRQLLIEEGWDGTLPAMTFGDSPAPWARRLARRARQRGILFLARVLRRNPRNISGFVFATDEEAVQHALRYPNEPVASPAHLAIARPIEVRGGTS